MITQLVVDIDKFDGTGTSWQTGADVTVRIRRPTILVGVTERDWARLTGIAVGEALARELESKMRKQDGKK